MAVTSDGTPYVEPGDAISAYPTVSQELAAVIDSLRTMIPVGAIFPYAGKVAPEGYLMCDGKAYTRTDFYDLYVVMAEWAGQWGGFPGGNSAQFFVPDFRGRSPIGVNTTETEITGPVSGLGQRAGDYRTAYHRHPLVFHFGNAEAAITVLTTATGSGSQYAMQYGGGNSYMYAGSAVPGSTADQDISSPRGTQDNLAPATVVNFIVWTGTTTAGKNPVPGVELTPVTTRQMIEARLEDAGIGEEEIEMLREQLAALKEDTNG